MEEPFILTVRHKGKERDFQAQLQLLGYTHRFTVDVEGTEVLFERDEEGSYRALLPPDITEKEASKIDVALLQAIAERIEALLA